MPITDWEQISDVNDTYFQEVKKLNEDLDEISKITDYTRSKLEPMFVNQINKMNLFCTHNQSDNNADRIPVQIIIGYKSSTPYHRIRKFRLDKVPVFRLPRCFGCVKVICSLVDCMLWDLQLKCQNNLKDAILAKKGGHHNRKQQMSNKLRFMILERDKFTCTYCGRNPKDDRVKLHVDHIHPKSKGGTDDESNLTTACSDCNHGKFTSVLKT